MESIAINIKSLLPHGSGVLIAKKLGISSSAVSQALKDGKPGSRAVQEALAMAKASGALEAAQTLASLVPNK
jgi:predicted transcriptional regulator